MNRHLPLLLYAAAAATLAIPAAAQQPSPTPVAAVAPVPPAEAVRAVDEALARATAEGRFSGAVLIAKDGQPVFQRAYGMADRERRIANTLETRFNLGSMNKMMTAVAIAQLVAEGKLSFQDPVAKYIPGFPTPAAARKIRIEHLLTHTSGLGSYFNPRFFRERPATVAAILDVARQDTALAFEPGTGWRYSNTGFLLLGAIIEKVTGQDYYDYVRDHVFAPAGMTASSWPAASEPGWAREYAPARDGGGTFTADDQRRGSPAGGGVSTVGDLLRFSRALLSGRLVPAQYVQTLTTPKPELGSRSYGYGFGVTPRPLRIVGHNGGKPGVFANLDLYPEAGYTTVLLMNQGDGEVQGDYVELLREAVRRMAGVAPPAADGPSIPLPDTPAGRAAAALLETMRGGDTAAIRRFVAERMGERFQSRPWDRTLALFRRMRGDFGSGRVVAARATDGGIRVTLASPRGRFDLNLGVEPAPPHRIVDLSVEVSEDGDDAAPSAAPASPAAPAAAGPLDAAARRAVIDSIAGALVAMYPSADTGRAIGDRLRGRERDGAYASLATAEDFARAVTQDMRALNGDRHLGLVPAARVRAGRMRPDEEAERAGNYGIAESRVIGGDVGYLKLTGLSGSPNAPARLGEALRAMGPIRAMIIDLRGAPGGSGQMANAVISHFTAPNLPSLRVTNRMEGTTEVRNTLAEVPGPRRTDIPVYVLVDRGSASAAEDVPFVLQSLGRATIVGEKTAGAGRNNAMVPVGPGLVASVSYTRVADARTGREWEVVGVKPDLEVPPADALDAALRAARQRIGAPSRR
ncbi:serine hydrolase [Longimicrobium sp.]|uniref:serine hydrolase n=1 Tax=Longimicrobium sp. TaxID=2029185 RepID=UPI002C20A002|nr:serine hydrolase [Longimicrobium sp.]HSU15633.1 serine hydrolase [Longimicrobium sp.]